MKGVDGMLRILTPTVLVLLIVYAGLCCLCSQSKLKFPPHSSVSSEARDLITQLLSDSKSRLCWPQLQQHPFFKSVFWDSIRNSRPSSALSDLHLGVHCYGFLSDKYLTWASVKIVSLIAFCMIYVLGGGGGDTLLLLPQWQIFNLGQC